MTTAGNQGQNVYPFPDNYPVTCFPQPVPAPSVDPDDAGTLIQVQYSWEWQQVLLAAVDQLLNPATWQGDHDDIILALNRATDLKDMLQIQVGDVQAPFWDEESGDDADDTALAIDQSWYGSWDGETFTETLAYVFLTNFLSSLVSPAAAVKFLTIPRTFRVAIKKNPHGANLLLFLDGGLYAVVNGYSIVDQVVEVIVKALPTTGFRAFDDEPLELMIVNAGTHDPDATPDANGNYTVGVLRSRLQASDVTPANMRYNPETDTVQTTPDGGTTWNDAPGQDPRSAPSFRLPARSGDNPRCDSAANMVAWVKAFMDEMIADLEGIGTAGLIISTALNAWSLLFEPIAIIDLIASVATTVGELGGSVLDAAFDSTTYDQLLCIFNCDAAGDGQIDDAAFAQVQSDIADKLNTTAAIAMALILGAQGAVGLSNAGAQGSATGDCSDCDCDCPPDLDWCEDLVSPLVNNDGGFVASSEGIWSGYGQYLWAGLPEGGNWNPTQCANRGSVESATLLDASRTLPSGHYTYLRVDWAVTFGTFTTDIREMDFKLDGSAVISSTTDEGTVTMHEVDIDVTGTPTLRMQAVLDYINPDIGHSGCTGFCRVVRITVGGVGTKPTF